MKPRKEHIPFLDHIRAVAILLVFFFHSLDASFGSDHFVFKWWFRDFSSSRVPIFLTPITFGFIGVAIFFVVSGFCIHLSHEGSRDKSMSTFFQRRFFRIYPPYFIALFVFAFLLPSTRLDFSSQFPGSLYQLVSHLFMIYNLDKTTHWGINPAFWSIAVEVQLYLLYPVLLWMTRKWGWTGALWITGFIEVALRVVHGAFPHVETFPYLQGVPLFYWFSWTIGAALADNYLKRQPLRFSSLPVSFWPAVTLVSCLFEPLYPFSFLFAALATASVISFLLRRSEQPSAVPSKPGIFSEYLRFVGLISYSIYLLHQPVVNMVPAVGRWLFPEQAPPGLVLYAMCFGAWILVTGLSYVFYRLIELPSIALGKWIGRRKQVNVIEIAAPTLPVADGR